MTDLKAPFAPDWISPPGDTIADILEELGWTQAELARRLGYTEKHVSQLINGEAPITEDTAARLERVLGSTPGFWLRKEAIYRKRLRLLHLAQQSAAPNEDVNVAGMPEFDGLLDHIYEYGTTSEGVIEKANAFARAVIARYAPQQPTEIKRDRLATTLQAEVEALRAEVNGTIRELLAERAQLTDENARLREALEDIQSLSFINPAMQPNPLTLTAMLGDIHQIADAALSKGDRND
jgi:addiction module HigA family antidote